MIDVYASFAALLNHPLEAGIAPDSRDQLNNFLGTDTAGCDYIVTTESGQYTLHYPRRLEIHRAQRQAGTGVLDKNRNGQRPAAPTVQSFH